MTMISSSTLLCTRTRASTAPSAGREAGSSSSSSSSSSVRVSTKSRVPPPLRCASSGMVATAGTAMYPLHRCKTIYLVRHAQGVHNVEGEKDFSAYMSHALFDAQLTPLGWKQVDGL